MYLCINTYIKACWESFMKGRYSKRASKPNILSQRFKSSELANLCFETTNFGDHTPKLRNACQKLDILDQITLFIYIERGKILGYKICFTEQNPPGTYLSVEVLILKAPSAEGWIKARGCLKLNKNLNLSTDSEDSRVFYIPDMNEVSCFQYTVCFCLPNWNLGWTACKNMLILCALCADC